MEQHETALSPVFIKLPTAQIVTLKFILESYEGLGVVRTLDAQKGEVVILAPADTVATLHELLESLRSDLQLRLVPAPPSVEGDWLLAAEKEFIRY